jgi:divalent metal cation (Fe/Co/Zn/Cd) transporter
MDTAPDQGLVSEISRTAALIPEVNRVEKCVVRKMGYHYFVDMHIEVEPEMTVQHAHNIAHLVKDRVRDHIPSVRDVLVHIEPRR